MISSPFGGTVFPVNPQRHSILGINSYSTIVEVAEVVNLAVIATPATTVPQVVRDCVAAGVKGAITVSAGLIVEQPQIHEIDINSLLVSLEVMIPLDARVVFIPPPISINALPLQFFPIPTNIPNLGNLLKAIA